MRVQGVVHDLQHERSGQVGDKARGDLDSF